MAAANVDATVKIRLKKEQEEKERKRKEKAEARLYTIIKVARDKDLGEQIGRDIYFDLVDHDKVCSFRIKKQMPFKLFKEEVAKELCTPVQCQRFWLWGKRENNTYRPHRPLTPEEEAQPVGQLREVSDQANNAELKLFLEVEPGQDLHAIPPIKSKDDILLFFKHYDPLKEELRYVGRLLVKATGKPVEILTKLNEMAGFSLDEEVELFEEIKFEPTVMCEHIDKKITFRSSELEDGDIICFQKAPQVGISEQCRYPDVPSFLEYVHNRQVVRFRSLEKPKADVFCLELSKLHNYDDVVGRVARHLALDDPSKLRLTAHDCYFQLPMPQPIKYQGVEHLSDMLVYYNQTSDILYYEVLDIPLPELQGLKTLKVAFHHSTKDEVVIHTIRLPKQSTVGDVINDLKTKVELSHPNVELRLLHVFFCKIYKIFLLNEKIEYIFEQPLTLRAEEIPKEEKNLGPHDRLIHVYHFMKDTAQNQVVQTFGKPFFLVIRKGEMLAEVKGRIQKKLQVPNEEFSKWKFAFFSLGRHDYLQDSDVISSRCYKDQHLGLEHSCNTPKRSYAANQMEPEHHSEQGSEPKLMERGQGINFGGSTTQIHSANAPAGKIRFLTYWVSSEASLLLERIHNIHKDTFTKFSMRGQIQQTVLLESFALFIESISMTKVNEVQEDVPRQATLSIEDFEQVGLELSWLKKRLEEATKAVNKRAESLIYVDSCETALREARAKVRKLEKGLVQAKMQLEERSPDLPNSLGFNDFLLMDIV